MSRYREPWSESHKCFARSDIWTGVPFDEPSRFSSKERVIFKLSVVVAICAAFFYGLLGVIL